VNLYYSKIHQET